MTRRYDPLLCWCVAAFVACLCGLLLMAVAHARPPEGQASSGYHDWFVTQRQEMGGPCCGDEEHVGGDGRYVDVQVRADGYYVFVREVGQWLKYPEAVNPDYPNPTGRNVAWYVILSSGTDRAITWYCLRLATGT